MPWPSNHVPKYRKHRKSGQAVVTIARRDYYLGPHGSKASLIEYDRLVTEWLTAGRSASFGAAADELTIIEVLAQYRKWANSYYCRDGESTGQFESIRPTLALLKTLYGKTSAVEFGPMALKTVRTKMIAKDWTRTHVNRNVDAIKRVFKWAASEELLPASVYENLRSVSGLKKGKTEARESRPVEPVPDTTVQLTLPELSEVAADMVRFQRLVGCRPTEVCLVRPLDVDTCGDVWTYRPESHKNEHRGKERVIFVGPKAQDVLRPYLLRSAETFCFSPVDSERKRREELTANRKTPESCGNTVGSNRRRNPKRTISDRYNANSYRKAIHHACDKAKIDRWSPNRLRHSAGTEIRKRFGLEAAQVALGHSQANVTQIYAERDHELAASVARQMG